MYLYIAFLLILLISYKERPSILCLTYKSNNHKQPISEHWITPTAVPLSDSSQHITKYLCQGILQACAFFQNLLQPFTHKQVREMCKGEYFCEKETTAKLLLPTRNF
jgi:hypothetical protein